MWSLIVFFKSSIKYLGFATVSFNNTGLIKAFLHFWGFYRQNDYPLTKIIIGTLIDVALCMYCASILSN